MKTNDPMKTETIADNFTEYEASCKLSNFGKVNAGTDEEIHQAFFAGALTMFYLSAHASNNLPEMDAIQAHHNWCTELTEYAESGRKEFNQRN